MRCLHRTQQRLSLGRETDSLQAKDSQTAGRQKASPHHRTETNRGLQRPSGHGVGIPDTRRNHLYRRQLYLYNLKEYSQINHNILFF